MKKNKVEELEVGHLYLVVPFRFSDGDLPKTKYLIPVKVGENSLTFILPTSRNLLPAQQEIRFGETTYQEGGPFVPRKNAFVMPAGTSATKKHKFVKETFVYDHCFHSLPVADIKRVISSADKIIDYGQLHSGLFGKLSEFHAKISGTIQKAEEEKYRQHGAMIGADGRTHVSAYEKKALLSIGLTIQHINELEILGETTIEQFYALPWKHREYNPEPPLVEKSLKLTLKPDGVHVVHGNNRHSELFVRIYDIFGQLERFAYSDNENPQKRVQIIPNIQETNSGFSRKK